VRYTMKPASRQMLTIERQMVMVSASKGVMASAVRRSGAPESESGVANSGGK
jgi:hypothetical protein